MTTRPPSLHDEHETFRNELASVARDGRRRWVYARKPSGRYYRARTVVSWFLLAFLLLAPFVQVRGQPLMLLNVLERRFVLLGVVFWPQDFYLVVLIALAVLVTLALATDHGRPRLVRLAVPADDLHGDGLPQDRVRDRGIGAAAAAPPSRPLDARSGSRAGSSRSTRCSSRCRSSSPTSFSPRSSAPVRCGRSSPIRPAGTWRDSSAMIDLQRRVLRACSRGSASRPACSPARTDA